MRRFLIVAVAAALMASGLHAAVADDGGRASLCGANDLPETGVQGDVPLADQLSGRAELGYNCGLALVGYEPLGRRGSNGNMAWVDDCAYIAGDGVAVVDVSDPANPRHVDTLHGPGSDDTLETIYALRSGDRAVLVAGRYSLFFDPGGSGPVDIYDASDCTHPQFMSTIEFPSGVHNLTLSPDTNTLWTTLPVQAADLTDLRQPRYLGSLENAIKATGYTRLEYAHEVTASADGNLLYIGGQVVGDQRPLIVDVTGWPEAPPRVVGHFGGAGHSIRTATIGGRPHLLHSDESVINPTALGCLPTTLTPAGGSAEPYLTDISDPAAPRIASHLELAINRPENCLTQLASGVNASSHYHDVDDPNHTAFAMVSMWNAGLRIFDVRDATEPAEVAYFNPGKFAAASGAAATVFDSALGIFGVRQLDQTWAHIRYRPDTGHIWLSTGTGGFWVLELEPQVRAALGLPALTATNPDGAPPRPAASQWATTAAAAAAGTRTALYCTLSGLL